MAKNLINIVSFTVLLVVLLMASTGIIKTEAQGVPCTAGCSPRAFLDECPAAHGTTDAICCSCCKSTYGSPPVCFAIIEGTDRHCHCYKQA
ncbi:PREDICTED: defensin-like protein 206 isoform X2 [Camelina sativa]|uniref:Defensin-like protein 206 n=1 Tax=Camelina sativa TaxID=90675 RepID=A0ABM0ZF02_CAMSA|nr:PREDICTED: defensin-like protein 206 [Camelina sativa]XP_010514826.1 PREDICTED: defensin-like protein 206 [Camelina sativa]XP_010514829.1 PREDICTED: defensin-like protein 206 isoform X2 [Camelina sativa]